jgi:hypothetical protein
MRGMSRRPYHRPAVRQRLPAGSPLAALGLAVTAVAAYVLTYALDTTSFLNDEYGTVTGGRVIARDPVELFTATGGVFARGPERLTSLALALPDALLGSTPAEMRGGHVVLALAYALVAVPAYALLRGLEVPRWPAAGLAVVAILGPWMVFGVTLLNVTLAAPLTVLFAWATWRAVVRPSVPAELLAVGAAALMTTARASHATFFAAAVLAAVATAWWTRPASTPLARFPLHLARRSPVIVVVTLLGGLALLVFGSSALAGRDYADAARLDFPADAVWSALGWTTASLTIACGFLPMIVGGAWALRQVVRPADVRAGAFAVIALTTFLAFVYLMGASGAQEQERYAAPLLALPVVAFGAALFRREAWPAGTVVVGVLCGLAVQLDDAAPGGEPLGHFFSPALLFFANELGVVAVVLAVAAAVAVVVVPRLRAAAVVALVVFGVLSGVYTLDRYEPATAPGDLGALAWADEAVDGETAMFWNYRWEANAGERDVRTRQALYFNGSLCCSEAPPDLESLLSGRGEIDRGTEPEPEFAVGHSGYRPVVLAALETGRPEVGGLRMRVERFVDGPAAAAVVVNAGADGAVEDEATVGVLRRACLDVELYNREDAPGPVGFLTRPSTGAVRGESGRLRPDQVLWTRVRVNTTIERTSGEVPLFIGEIRYVGCDDPPTTR